jgi:predicted nucleotidyltransferase
MPKEDKKLALIRQYLTMKASPYLIILFGSSVKGAARSDSDIDLAFLNDQSLSEYDIFMIAQGLADLLKQPVDLVDLNKVSTVFQAQVVGTGQIIYCTDEVRRMYFEMKVLKMYAKLNEERKPILDRIMESGSIYAE